MKPILFNTEMVKAILDGRKKQFIMPIKLKDNSLICTGYIFSSTDRKRNSCYSFGKNKEHDLEYIKPKYKVDDILYVKEPAKIIGNHKQIGNIYERTCNFKYLADDKIIENFNIPYRLSASHINQFLYKNMKGTWLTGNKGVPIGCIKEMARIFLKVTNVRVERLQNISVRNIEKETGWRREIYSYSNKNKAFLRDYCDFWNSTAKDGYRWKDNPYVFVYEVERVELREVNK